MTSPIVSVRSLEYGVNDVEILRGVEMDVSQGEFVGIIGPNGAGKTTLLKLMLGVIKPTAGRVLLEQEAISSIKPKTRARIQSYLSQDVMTTFPYPVLDIVLMGRYPYVARFSGENESDIEIVRRALAYVGLSDFENRFFNELSGGERQLVLFAKVLAQNTKLLILDEPTANLDIRHQDQFFSMASELASEGKAVVAAVHNLDIASRYCSRLVLLDNGKIAAVGKPAEVLVPEILDPVYGIETTVSENTATGSLMVNVLPRNQSARERSVHLIGGAGSAINLTRELVRLGFYVTGGVSHRHDADEPLWKALGISYQLVEPFSRITSENLDSIYPWVEAADLTVLCDFPIGPGNLLNLELARRARRLVIIEESAASHQRSFFSDEGRRVFKELKATADVMSYADLIAVLESGSIPSH